MISLLASKCQDFKLRGLSFHFIKQLINGHSNFKDCYFEASEDIITKFKSQALHITRIKYWKASGSGSPPSLIPALQKIAILGLKIKFSTLRCQINESTRLAFLDFSPPYLHFFHPTWFANFPPTRLIGTFFHPTHINLAIHTLLWNLLRLSTLLVYLALLV
jgi:hypothetical protein